MEKEKDVSVLKECFEKQEKENNYFSFFLNFRWYCRANNSNTPQAIYYIQDERHL